MVLDAALLNTQYYKVRIKGKVEQSRKWSSALPYTYVAIEKGSLRVTLNKGRQLCSTYIVSGNDSFRWGHKVDVSEAKSTEWDITIETQSAGAVTQQQLYLYRRIRPPNVCPGNVTYKSDGEAPVILVFWGMWITPSMTLLPDPLGPGVVAPDRVLSMGRIELLDILIECKQMTFDH